MPLAARTLPLPNFHFDKINRKNFNRHWSGLVNFLSQNTDSSKKFAEKKSLLTFCPVLQFF